MVPDATIIAPHVGIVPVTPQWCVDSTWMVAVQGSHHRSTIWCMKWCVLGWARRAVKLRIARGYHCSCPQRNMYLTFDMHGVACAHDRVPVLHPPPLAASKRHTCMAHLHTHHP